MGSFNLTATVTRTELSLGDLDLNDRTKFIAVSFQPGDLKWNRTEATSPFYDGAVTTHRNRQRSSMQTVIDVIGATQTALHDNLRELVAAFQQTEFDLTVTYEGQTWVWKGEAADVSTSWDDSSRLRERRLQVVLQYPTTVEQEPLL